MTKIDTKFPLIDLHRHLDGNVRIETIIELGHKYGIPLPSDDVEGLRPYVQITDPTMGVMAFIERMKWMTAILVNEKECYRIAYENVEDALKEGLDYVELRFSPWFMAESHNLDPVGVVEAVCDGITAGIKDFGMKVKLIGIISRTYGVETAFKELNALLRQSEKLVAIDLAGDEANQRADLFVEHFKQVRDQGLHVIAHAGESDGPESIWHAIKNLGAIRIGHAVRVIEDLYLMEYMKKNRISIESNLTSNVQTSTVPDYASHPIGEILDFGILTNLNTDDPGISGIDIHYEYNVAAPAAGLTDEQIHQVQYNALEMGFLSKSEKEQILSGKMEKGG